MSFVLRFKRCDCNYNGLKVCLKTSLNPHNFHKNSLFTISKLSLSNVRLKLSLRHRIGHFVQSMALYTSLILAPFQISSKVCFFKSPKKCFSLCLKCKQAHTLKSALITVLKNIPWHLLYPRSFCARLSISLYFW